MARLPRWIAAAVAAVGLKLFGEAVAEVAAQGTDGPGGETRAMMVQLIRR
jgi:hypothetical protein